VKEQYNPSSSYVVRTVCQGAGLQWTTIVLISLIIDLPPREVRAIITRMSQDSPTSIYVTKQLKRRLVETAEAEGFWVGRGRTSRLSEFIETMLREHDEFSEHDPAVSSLRSLTPELRSLIGTLSQMDAARQRRACALLNLLFDDAGFEQGSGGQE
jgi:hypothetical protein